MRIARVGVRHSIFRDLSRLRIELADRSSAVARVPDVAERIVDDAVRIRSGLELPFGHFTGCGIETADEMAVHAGPPDHAVRRHERIARALAQRRHGPLEERDARIAVYELGPAVIALGQIRREVVCDVGGERLGQFDHRACQTPPLLVRIPRRAVNDVGLVAGDAGRFDELLAGPFRQIAQRLLCERGQRESGQ